MVQRNLDWIVRALVLSVLVGSQAGFRLFAEEKKAEEKAAVAESETRLRDDVGYLASDELEGRGVGTDGINKAADFLAAEFGKLGLKTNTVDGGAFQKFTMATGAEMGPKEHNRLLLKGPAPEGSSVPRLWDLTLEKDFTPLAAGGSGSLDGQLAFVGYGISAPDLNYDEYAGIDVKDKIVVMIRKEPQQNDPHSVFKGTEPSDHATFLRKFSVVRDRGAKAVIVVNAGFDLKKSFDTDRKAYEETMAKLAELSKPLPPEASPEEFSKRVQESTKLLEQATTLSKRLTANSYDELLSFTGAGDGGRRRRVPVVFCKRSVIEPLIEAAMSKKLTDIEDEIDGQLKPQSKVLEGWTAEGEVKININEAEVKNVIAVMEGTGPNADETIVIGAHYDHVGRGGPESLAPWTKDIHNGADDNASGTATLLEVAHRLVASGYKPNRRIVFIAFTAEEKGLLGSAHYCEQPVFPLEKTIAMLNMDMVGRLSEDKLIVYGTGTATEFDPLITKLSDEGHFKLTKIPGGFGPSDHASFYAKKIPVLHFFTGTHGDYHRPTDDTDKLNIDGMRRVADMVTAALQQIDQAQGKPNYVEIKQVESMVADTSDRPYFGSIPDYAKEVEGLALSGVAPEGPAAKGGLKGGDVIIQLGDTKVTDIELFMVALTKHKAGDKVKVKYLRDGKEHETEVELTKRPGRP
jgi:hypothetical protein